MERRTTLYAIGRESLLRLVVHGRHHNITAFHIGLDRPSDEPFTSGSVESLASRHGVRVLELHEVG